MSDKRVVLALYRAALREARRIDCLCEPTRGLSVRAPMAIAQFGPDHCWSRPEAEYRLDTLRALLPGLLQMPRSGRFKRLELKQLIRNNFVAGATAGGAELGRLLDLAFAALRVLAEQLLLERCSSHATTQGCRVECTTALEGRDANGYHYVYRCRIENARKEKLQLVSRRLVFKNEDGATVVDVARGAPGVVGCTPTLRHNDCFQYHSRVTLPGPAGSIRGAYQMTTKPQAPGVPVRGFDAAIAPCRFLAEHPVRTLPWPG